MECSSKKDERKDSTITNCGKTGKSDDKCRSLTQRSV